MNNQYKFAQPIQHYQQPSYNQQNGYDDQQFCMAISKTNNVPYQNQQNYNEISYNNPEPTQYSPLAHKDHLPSRFHQQYQFQQQQLDQWGENQQSSNQRTKYQNNTKINSSFDQKSLKQGINQISRSFGANNHPRAIQQNQQNHRQSQLPRIANTNQPLSPNPNLQYQVIRDPTEYIHQHQTPITKRSQQLPLVFRKQHSEQMQSTPHALFNANRRMAQWPAAAVQPTFEPNYKDLFDEQMQQNPTMFYQQNQGEYLSKTSKADGVDIQQQHYSLASNQFGSNNHMTPRPKALANFTPRRQRQKKTKHPKIKAHQQQQHLWQQKLNLHKSMQTGSKINLQNNNNNNYTYEERLNQKLTKAMMINPIDDFLNEQNRQSKRKLSLGPPMALTTTNRLSHRHNYDFATFRNNTNDNFITERDQSIYQNNLYQLQQKGQSFNQGEREKNHKHGKIQDFRDLQRDLFVAGSSNSNYAQLQKSPLRTRSSVNNHLYYQQNLKKEEFSPSHRMQQQLTEQDQDQQETKQLSPEQERQLVERLTDTTIHNKHCHCCSQINDINQNSPNNSSHKRSMVNQYGSPHNGSNVLVNGNGSPINISPKFKVPYDKKLKHKYSVAALLKQMSSSGATSQINMHFDQAAYQSMVPSIFDSQNEMSPKYTDTQQVQKDQQQSFDPNTCEFVYLKSDEDQIGQTKQSDTLNNNDHENNNIIQDQNSQNLSRDNIQSNMPLNDKIDQHCSSGVKTQLENNTKSENGEMQIISQEEISDSGKYSIGKQNLDIQGDIQINEPEQYIDQGRQIQLNQVSVTDLAEVIVNQDILSFDKQISNSSSQIKISNDIDKADKMDNINTKSDWEESQTRLEIMSSRKELTEQETNSAVGETPHHQHNHNIDQQTLLELQKAYKSTNINIIRSTENIINETIDQVKQRPTETSLSQRKALEPFDGRKSEANSIQETSTVQQYHSEHIGYEQQKGAIKNIIEVASQNESITDINCDSSLNQKSRLTKLINNINQEQLDIEFNNIGGVEDQQLNIQNQESSNKTKYVDQQLSPIQFNSNLAFNWEDPANQIQQSDTNSYNINSGDSVKYNKEISDNICSNGPSKVDQYQQYDNQLMSHENEQVDDNNTQLQGSLTEQQISSHSEDVQILRQKHYNKWIESKAKATVPQDMLVYDWSISKHYQYVLAKYRTTAKVNCIENMNQTDSQLDDIKSNNNHQQSNLQNLEQNEPHYQNKLQLSNLQLYIFNAYNIDVDKNNKPLINGLFQQEPILDEARWLKQDYQAKFQIYLQLYTISPSTKQIYSETEVSYKYSLLKKKVGSYKDADVLKECHLIAKQTIAVLTENTIVGEAPLEKIYELYEPPNYQNAVKLLLRCKKMYEARVDIQKILLLCIQKMDMQNQLLFVIQEKDIQDKNNQEVMIGYGQLVVKLMRAISQFRINHKVFKGHFVFDGINLEILLTNEATLIIDSIMQNNNNENDEIQTLILGLQRGIHMLLKSSDNTTD